MLITGARIRCACSLKRAVGMATAADSKQVRGKGPLHHYRYVTGMNITSAQTEICRRNSNVAGWGKRELTQDARRLRQIKTESKYGGGRKKLSSESFHLFPIFLFFSHGEDLIVTPFAQILASLRSVRNNFQCLTNVPTNKSRRSSGAATSATPQPRNLVPGDEAYMKMAMETMEELDWCLDQLETIQTHRSVSDMASLKVNSGKFGSEGIGAYATMADERKYLHWKS
ncbi:cAMP-specific 3',5'-cyclic phosphodiesterase, isoforms N/G-like Protein [Tribolium castaneum]|uniref:3',5'-cyclic-AMP phosphodiesterase n=1 Tax=Tribolium castaneum TaxID=7070 RepID=A0A139WBF4_TRICA|nr:cAMP-specific 3',5'-cyclic phosphodiesterase, isoforms N/G-like Protein [Tribolium castaneum]